MILYGWRGSLLGSVPAPGVECPMCKSKDNSELHVMSMYAHVYYLPLFAYKKKAVFLCKACNFSHDLNKYNPEHADVYNAVQTHYKHKWWMFIGAGLIAIAIVAGSISSYLDSEENAEFINQPQAGDIFQIKQENGRYTCFKVLNVRAGTLDVVFNQYEITDKVGFEGNSKTEGIDRPENYTDTAKISRSQLKELEKNGDIVDVIRE